MNKYATRTANVIATIAATSAADLAELTKARDERGVGLAFFADLLSPTQASACVELIDLLNEDADAAQCFTTQASAIVARIFPKPADYDTWRAVAGEIERNTGGYRARILREAYVALHRALPTKGDKRATGAVSKGMHKGKAAAGLAARVKALVDYMETVNSVEFDGKLLVTLATAVTTLQDVSSQMSLAAAIAVAQKRDTKAKKAA